VGWKSPSHLTRGIIRKQMMMRIIILFDDKNLRDSEVKGIHVKTRIEKDMFKTEDGNQ